jgi:hypothetical protein
MRLKMSNHTVSIYINDSFDKNTSYRVIAGDAIDLIDLARGNKWMVCTFKLDGDVITSIAMLTTNRTVLHQAPGKKQEVLGNEFTVGDSSIWKSYADFECKAIYALIGAFMGFNEDPDCPWDGMMRRSPVLTLVT